MNGISEQALAALAAGGRRAAEESDLDEALRALGEAAAEATGAEAVVIRVAGENGMLDARSVVSRSEVLAAELAGSTFPVVELKGDESRGDQLPEAVRRAARRARATDVVLLTARGGGKVLGSLTLFRSRRVFAPGDMVAARFAASHLGLVLRAFLDTNGAAADRASFARALSLAGDALAVGLERAKAADEVVRISARAAGAEAAVLWYPGLEGALELLASVGPIDALPRQERAGRALAEREPVRLEPDGDGHGRTVASFTLGQPPVGVLELAFPAGASPSQAEIDRLATFAVRAAQALRAGERAEAMSLELERSEALLAVVGQATAELSLAHTLETAVARVSELLRCGARGRVPAPGDETEARGGARGDGLGARRRRAAARAGVRPSPCAGNAARLRRAGRPSPRIGERGRPRGADRRGARRAARRPRGADRPARRLPPSRA